MYIQMYIQIVYIYIYVYIYIHVWTSVKPEVEPHNTAGWGWKEVDSRPNNLTLGQMKRYDSHILIWGIPQK